MSEEWRSIPGYERTYRVSSIGRVESIPRPRTRGGLLSIKLGKRGYPAVALVQDGKQATHEVHRLVALAFLGPRPEGQEVRHLDGDRTNCTASNLAYGTRSENLADAQRHGTHPTGSRTHCPRGHAYNAENTRLYQGRRYCKGCYR